MIVRCFWRRENGLDFSDVLGCGTSRAVFNFKTHPFTFSKCSESLHGNCRVVDEQITAFIFLDKAVPLPIIKPFYCSFRQNIVSFVAGG